MTLPAQGVGVTLRLQTSTGGYEYADNKSTGATVYHEWIMVGYNLSVRPVCSNPLCSDLYTNVLPYLFRRKS